MQQRWRTDNSLPGVGTNMNMLASGLFIVQSGRPCAHDEKDSCVVPGGSSSGGAAWYGIGKHDSSTAVAAVEGAAEQSDEHSLARGAPTTPTNAVESTPWARADSHLAGSWFADLRSRAEAGDVLAQRQLAEAYQRCAVFSLSPANMYATLDAYAEVRGCQHGPMTTSRSALQPTAPA